jgi:hypothetical protein
MVEDGLMYFQARCRCGFADTRRQSFYAAMNDATAHNMAQNEPPRYDHDADVISVAEHPTAKVPLIGRMQA